MPGTGNFIGASTSKPYHPTYGVISLPSMMLTFLITGLITGSESVMSPMLSREFSCTPVDLLLRRISKSTCSDLAIMENACM